jgi:hypothetical protein
MIPVLLLSWFKIQRYKIILTIKSRRLRWAERVARMEEKRNTYKVLVGNMYESDNLDNLGVDGRINMKWIMMK